MHTCIYTKKQFSSATGEHILQNSLGARWVSETISCNEIQKQFGDTIDSEFARNLNEFRTLLGTAGGRGGTPPPIKGVTDDAGNKYNIIAGGKPEIAEPIIQTQEKDGLTEIQIQLGHKNQLGWALHLLQRRNPSLKIDTSKIPSTLVKTSDYLDSPVRLEFGIGGPDFFRAALKAVFNLLGAQEKEIALQSELDEVRNFIVSAAGDSQTFVGWPIDSKEIKLPKLGTHDHVLAVWSESKVAYGFLQLFGQIPFVFKLGTLHAEKNFCHSYIVDPFRTAEPPERRNHEDFSPSNIPRFDDCAHLPCKDVFSAHEARVGRFFQEYKKRAEEQEVSKIIDDVFQPKLGQPITEEDCGAIMGKIMRLCEARLRSK